MAYPRPFTDLERHITSILLGKPPKTQADLSEEFQRLRAAYGPAGDAVPDRTVNANEATRRSRVSVILDYLGEEELTVWARMRDIPI